MRRRKADGRHTCSTCAKCHKKQWWNASDAQNDTAGPDVDSAAVIALASDNFRSAVGGRAADSLEQLTRYHVVAQAEICELHVEFVVEPERTVLRGRNAGNRGRRRGGGGGGGILTTVTMRNVLAVAVVDGR